MKIAIPGSTGFVHKVLIRKPIAEDNIKRVAQESAINLCGEKIRVI